MTFGIIPKHILEIPIEELTSEEFLILALEAAKACSWKLTFISRSGFRAESVSTIVSSGEVITCDVHQHTAGLTSESKGKQFFNTKRNQKNTEIFFSNFSKLRTSLSKIDLHHKYEEWQHKFTDEEDTLTREKPTKRGFDLFRIFIPVEGYFITPLLINLNTFILILMVFSGANLLWPDAEIVLKWGGDLKPVTLGRSEWWRMITANFLHFGIIHLFFNMNALLYIGIILEPLLGRWKFLLAYLLTGLTSAMGSLLLNDYAVSAGASGSIFGMYGVFFALLTTNFLEKENRMSTLKSIGIFLVFNLALGGSIGADNGGHLGGLAGGLFIGYCYYFIFLKPESGLLNFLIISFMTFILIGGTAYGYFNISDPVGTYQKKLDAFTINEQKAQNLYSELNTTDTSIMAKNIQKELSLWAENISLIQESTTLKLPKEFELRNVLLQRYAQLRFQIFRFALQDLRHPSPENKKQLENYTSEMEYILKKLNTKEETSD